MSVESDLVERSKGICELCASDAVVSIYDVIPNDGIAAETSAMVCSLCTSQIEKPDTIDKKHWYCLSESIWSEHDVIKVLSYRVLSLMAEDPWAQDLIGQIYLEDAALAWAKAGLPEQGEGAGAITKDSNGNQLNAGDTVTIIKDLDVKGANFTAKRGTTVKGISLTGDPKLIEGRVNGTKIVLVAAYLKKA